MAILTSWLGAFCTPGLVLHLRTIILLCAATLALKVIITHIFELIFGIFGFYNVIAGSVFVIWRYGRPKWIKFSVFFTTRYDIGWVILVSVYTLVMVVGKVTSPIILYGFGVKIFLIGV